MWFHFFLFVLFRRWLMDDVSAVQLAFGSFDRWVGMDRRIDELVLCLSGCHQDT